MTCIVRPEPSIRPPAAKGRSQPPGRQFRCIGGGRRGTAYAFREGMPLWAARLRRNDTGGIA